MRQDGINKLRMKTASVFHGLYVREATAVALKDPSCKITYKQQHRSNLFTRSPLTRPMSAKREQQRCSLSPGWLQPPQQKKDGRMKRSRAVNSSAFLRTGRGQRRGGKTRGRGVLDLPVVKKHVRSDKRWGTWTVCNGMNETWRTRIAAPSQTPSH